ncbi:MAG TPA: hypothetical protein VLK55_03770 [Kocuria rosea]|nr:hypothetical protein [Kocuria rosea]
MKDLRTKLAAATLAGLLASGSFGAPAFAGGDGKDKEDTTDGKVLVVSVKHKQNGGKKIVESKPLSYEKAAKRVAEKCDIDGWKERQKLEKKAYRTDHKNKKWVYVCTDEGDKKDKHDDVEYYFSDNHEKDKDDHKKD